MDVDTKYLAWWMRWMFPMFFLLFSCVSCQEVCLASEVQLLIVCLCCLGFEIRVTENLKCARSIRPLPLGLFHWYTWIMWNWLQKLLLVRIRQIKNGLRYMIEGSMEVRPHAILLFIYILTPACSSRSAWQRNNHGKTSEAAKMRNGNEKAAS